MKESGIRGRVIQQITQGNKSIIAIYLQNTNILMCREKLVKLLKSDAIISNVRNASSIIAKLKAENLINIQLKVSKSSNEIYIPLVRGAKEKIVNRRYFTFEYRFDTCLFEETRKKAKSLKESLEREIPVELHDKIPVAFDMVGDLVVVDLKSELDDYEQTIGTTLLTFNPAIKGVYRKIQKVSGLKRIRGLKHMAGEKRTQTIHREYGLRIFLDIEKIYFSPRLSTEHRRIAEMVEDGERVLDMFGAAAPFALHIASLHECTITTLDINEDSRGIIEKSISMNKKQLQGKVEIIVGDAKDIVKNYANAGIKFDRIIMNHPSAALDYLEDASKVLEPGGTMHLYTFAPVEQMKLFCETEVRKREARATITDIHSVRPYSQTHHHICIDISI